MTSALWKNVFKDISKTKARFISIMLIVALGVGFFAGVKATSPSMNVTAEEYYRQNNLMDIRLLSTVGFNDEDVEQIKNLDHVRAVAPSYFTDVLVNSGKSGSVLRLYSLPEEDENGIIMNEPIIKEGRLPEAKGEIALDNASFSGGGYQLGDIIKIEPEIEGEPTTDTLESLEYTIVGFIQSPLYVSFERGTTTVGSGSINLFGIISKEEFVSERYTQMYVLTDYSDGSIDIFSDEYTDSVKALEDEFEQLGLERAKDFDGEYLVEARQELADAQEELDSERDKAEKELADAEQELKDAEEEYNTQISEAQDKLDEANSQITSAEKEIEQGWEDYNKGIEEGQKQLDDAKEQLKSGQEELDTAKKEYETQIREAEKQLNAAEREYNKGLAEYQEGLAEFNSQTLTAKLGLALLDSNYDLAKNRYENTTKPACESVISNAQAEIDKAELEIADLQSQLDLTEDTWQKTILQTKINTRNATIQYNQGIIDSQNEILAEAEAEVNEKKQELDDATAEYESATAEPKAQLDEAKAQLDSAKAQIDSGRAELETQKTEGQAQLTAAQEEITNGQAALTVGQQELATQKTEGKEKLKSAEEELEKAKEEYETGKAEFEEEKENGRQQLDDAKTEFEEAKAEAEAKLNDAQVEIDKAEEKLNDLENPEWFFFTRTDNPGYQSLIDDTTRIDAVATVFPLFFLLVAALVCLTTLSRHVEEKRTEIGTLKALGYSSNAIQAQFIVYASGAALLGCVLGITLGMFTLPYVIYDAYGIMYELLPLKLSVPWDIVIIGVAVAFLCTTLVALYTCHKALREKPSSLMRPKSPKIGKKILLERIPFIWNRMNFTSKVTARNIVRYKVRFLMTVLGVAGCTALMLAGFGLKGSISSIVSKQFGEIITYDMLAVLSEEGTANQKKDLFEELTSNEYIESAMLERQTAIEVKDDRGENPQADVYMVVPQSVEAMKEFIHLRERESGKEINLTDSGAVLTEKLAKLLGVSVGDNVIIVEDNKEYPMTVTGICENYVYGYVFVSSDYYKEIYGKDALFNMVMSKMTDVNEETESKLGNICLDNDGIAAVSFISGSIDSFNDTVKSLDTVVFVLIICAGLLAIVVLYNLTNINIAERVREIATIKVLGFYNGETCAFVYRENIILTLCGIIAGLGLGTILHRFIILTIEVNKTMFGREISLMSFLFAAVLTAFFAAIVNYVMYFKIKKIDMVESLKSIE